MPRALVLFVLIAGCGSPVPAASLARSAPPEPPPDWEVRRCGDAHPWDGAEAFHPSRLDDGAPYVPATLITDQPLEIALLRDVMERDRTTLRLVILRCDGARWVEHAKIELGAGDRTLARADRQLAIEPLAFGDRMATLVRVIEPTATGPAGEWLVLLAGDRSRVRSVVAQPVSGSPRAFLAPRRGGVALLSVRERNGRIEGRVIAAIDSRGADADAPDALWMARVRARPAICSDAIRCYAVCGDVHFLASWERAEDVPLSRLGTSPSLIWLGRGAAPAAPAPLATVRPGLDRAGDPACVY